MKSITLFLLLFFILNSASTHNDMPDEQINKIYKLINQFRKRHALPKLKYLRSRQEEVNLWAKHLERNFEHAKGGYSCENIAVNFKGPDELFYQWKKSPPHRRNMLNRKIKYCAIGLHTGKYKSLDEAFFGVFRGYYSNPKP